MRFLAVFASSFMMIAATGGGTCFTLSWLLRLRAM